MIVYFQDKGAVRAVELGDHQVTLLEGLGMIQRTEGGGLFGGDFQEAMLTLIEHPSALVCDFCGEQPIHWLYECKTTYIDAGASKFESNDWAVCNTCADLIEANEWQALTDRATTLFYDKNPQFVDNAAEVIAAGMMIQTLHESFRKNRTGERMAV